MFERIYSTSKNLRQQLGYPKYQFCSVSLKRHINFRRVMTICYKSLTWESKFKVNYFNAYVNVVKPENKDHPCHGTPKKWPLLRGSHCSEVKVSSNFSWAGPRSAGLCWQVVVSTGLTVLLMKAKLFACFTSFWLTQACWRAWAGWHLSGSGWGSSLTRPRQPDFRAELMLWLNKQKK